MFGLVPFRKNNDLAHQTTEFDRLMDSFFDDSQFLGLLGNPRTTESFKVDVKDNEDEYLVEAELPGVNKEDINLRVQDDTLSISVNVKQEENKENKNYIRKERRMSSYCRSFRLDGINNEKVEAQYKDGILSIHLPKEERKQNGHNIEIH